MTILTRNYRCKLGEIDIIAARKRALHFVEVRYRKNDRFGSGADSVTLTKQRKLKRSATYFLQCNPQYESLRCQFDVVSVSGTHYPYSIDWIEDAFQ